MRPKVMASPRRSSLAGREREYNRNRNGRYNPIQRRRVMSRVATSTDETPKPACFLSRNLRLAGSAVLLCLWWGSLHKALQLDLRSISLHAIAPWPFHDLALSGNTIRLRSESSEAACCFFSPVGAERAFFAVAKPSSNSSSSR